MQDFLTHSSSHSSSSLPESLISSLSPSRSLSARLMGAGLGSDAGSAIVVEVNGSSMLVGVGSKVGTWSEESMGASSGRGLGIVFEVCFKGLSVSGGVVD